MEKNNTTGSVFSAGKQDRVRSPEELDAYIRVVRPGVMILIGALALVAVALVIWGFTGTLPYSKTVSGVIFSKYDRPMATMTDSEKGSVAYNDLSEYQISLDDEVNRESTEKQVFLFLNAFDYERDDLIGRQLVVRYPAHADITGTVVKVDATPLTEAEIINEFGSSWIAANCADSEFSWVVHGELDQADFLDIGMVVDVTLVTDNVRPISFLLR